MKFNGLFGNLDKSLKGITGCISDGSKYPTFGGRGNIWPCIGLSFILFVKNVFLQFFNLHAPTEIQLMRMST